MVNVCCLAVWSPLIGVAGRYVLGIVGNIGCVCLGEQKPKCSVVYVSHRRTLSKGVATIVLSQYAFSIDSTTKRL